MTTDGMKPECDPTGVAGEDSGINLSIIQHKHLLLAPGESAIVAFRSYATGQYVTVLPDGNEVRADDRLALVASKNSIGTNEKFLCEYRVGTRNEDSLFTFKSLYNNKYISSDWNRGPSGRVTANKDVVGDWETYFVNSGVIKDRGPELVTTLSNRSSFGLGRHVSARFDIPGALRGCLASNVQGLGEWEIFFADFL